MPFGVFTATPEQLDAIAEFVGGGEIGRRDRGNAFDIDRALIDLGAEGKARQDRELLRGVVAFDVEGRIGLGIAEPLRLLQALGERQLLLLHPRQDVIAGAVEDAVDALDRVAGQAFAQRLHDRNGGADRRFEIERDAVLLGERGELDAVLGEQRLVGGDHRLAGRERRLDRGLGRIAGAADQFDEHVDVGRARQRDRIGEPFHRSEIDAAILGARARADRDDLDGAPATRGQRLALRATWAIKAAPTVPKPATPTLRAVLGHAAI